MKQESITLTKRNCSMRCIPSTGFLTAVMLAGVIMTLGRPASAQDVSAGFLFDRFKLTLEEGYRTEAAGPFYYSQQADSGNVWAIPPFYSCDRNSSVEAHEDDFLYPLLTDVRYGHERRWQFCQLLSLSWGVEPDEAMVKRFTL